VTEDESVPPAAAPDLVLGFPDYREQGQALARALGVVYQEVEIHRFPDGESRVRLPAELPERVVLCRSLDRPNDKLVELLLASRTARQLGAQDLALVAPYLCYMRQDTAFRPGEAVSQEIVGRLLAESFDALITVEPHLHRVSDLRQVIPLPRARALGAAPLMAQFLVGHLPDPVLVGPDVESTQWVEAIARLGGLTWRAGRKVRRGDRAVGVTLAPGPYANRHLVVVDDVASTGRTLEAVIEGLQPLGPASLSVLVCHALFVGDAVARLQAMGVANIWSSDSLTHPSNRIPLATLLARALVA
jgi:ribose-phosphate pyrophosphokinase